MSYSTVKSKIDALRAKTTANSITPESLGSILQDILDEQSTGSQRKEDFLFANIQGLTVEGSVETELHVGSDIDYQTNNHLLRLGNAGQNEPIFVASQSCIVQITGQISLQPISSYTSDRVLRWFVIDGDGERVNTSIMTTHFTGNTQIFNVPINYSTYLNAGETLHLTAYASGSNGTLISSNSRINVHVIEQ